MKGLFTELCKASNFIWEGSIVTENQIGSIIYEGYCLQSYVRPAILYEAKIRELDLLYYIYEGDCLQSYVRPAILYEREV